MTDFLDQDETASPRLSAEQITEVRRRQVSRRYANDEQVSAFFERVGTLPLNDPPLAEPPDTPRTLRRRRS